MAASLNEVFDVLIIGCGAVGAAVAREMALLGQKCIVLEYAQQINCNKNKMRVNFL